MPHLPTVTFDSPILFAVAMSFTLLAAAIAITRRALLPRAAALLVLLGLFCIAAAAGGLRWWRGDGGEVAVMVDVSPSTRGASYHDPEILRRRLAQLLGRTPYRIYSFAGDLNESKLESVPDEIPARRTIFNPPAGAAAVLLFSDGQFDFPVDAPPTYAAIDPGLQRAEDAAIENMEIRDETVTISTRNSGLARQLRIAGATPTTHPVDLDRSLLAARLNDSPADVSARLLGRDRWPENDALTIRPPPPQRLQRWWVSHRPPPDASWRRVEPRKIPPDATDYLPAGVIVLDNIAPDEFEGVQREHIEQYVAELGGGLLILGGEHAFAAGGYVGAWFGRIFDRLSPLASSPPQPMTHWIFLVDASGSMASRIGDNTRWRFATTAVTDLIPTMPASDPLTLGNFAADVRWWQSGRTVAETDRSHVVPDDVRPLGPTNLEPALRQIVQSADGATPTHLLLITDAETALPNAQALAQQLADKRVIVHAITTAALAANHPLRVLVDRTGGRFVAQEDPRRWGLEVQQVLRSVISPWLMRDPVTARFTDAGPDLPAQSVTLWNRTWLKPKATLLAKTTEGENAPMAAAWNYGAGAVIAVAYSPAPAVIEALAERVSLPPRDPRFIVDWTLGPQVRVRVDAQQDGRHVNDLPLQLVLLSWGRGGDTTHAIAQTAPGRYEVTFAAPTHPVIASVVMNDHVLDRRAIAGRYPAEFDAIGNNMESLRHLAEQTGGQIIEPTRTTPIEFRRPMRSVSLASFLAAAGAVLVGAGLVRWRLA